MTPEAQAYGLQIGMRRNTALALCAGIALQDRNPEAEAQLVRRIAAEMLRYTPKLTIALPHTLAFEVSASLSLFHGPRSLIRSVHDALRRQPGVHYRLGMGPTARGACLLARQTGDRRRRTLRIETLRRLLASLPLSLMDPAPAQLEWLQGLGCHTLAQFHALPRAGMRRRGASTLLDALDEALGFRIEHHAWFTSPELFSVRRELLHNLESQAAIHAAAQTLIEELCAWLQARQGAASVLLFQLHHEKGRHASPPSLLILEISRPGWLPSDFLPILAERLPRTPPCAPVIAMELSIPAMLSRPAASQSLFPEPGQWLADEHRLLDLLRARLGGEHVLEAAAQADHRPEQANGWIPAAARSAKPVAPTQLTRPFWLLPVPLELHTRNDHPVYRNATLRLLKGPERIETAWWETSGSQRRDYFVAEDANAARYWIYRQRESLQARWYLHGLFA